MLSTSHCSTIPTMMNRIWWIEPNYNLALVIPAVHTKVAVMEIWEANLCGMQIVWWCLTTKKNAMLVMFSVISIPLHASEKLILLQWYLWAFKINLCFPTTSMYSMYTAGQDRTIVAKFAEQFSKQRQIS